MLLHSSSTHVQMFDPIRVVDYEATLESVTKASQRFCSTFILERFSFLRSAFSKLILSSFLTTCRCSSPPQGDMEDYRAFWLKVGQKGFFLFPIIEVVHMQSTEFAGTMSTPFE